MANHLPPPQSGKTEGDSAVGRLLLETLSRIPQVEPAKYEAMVNSLMQVRHGADSRGLSNS